MQVPFDAVSCCNKMRSEARRLKVPFNIDADYLRELVKETPRCPITDTILFYTEGRGGKPNTPNFVRLIRHEGFVYDNLIVVCSRARSIRQDGSPNEFRRWANIIEKAEIPR